MTVAQPSTPLGRGLLKAVSFSAAAQLTNSASNFALGVALLALQERSEFGLYSVAFSVVIIVGGAVAALAVPFTVTAARRGVIGRVRAGADNLWLALALCVLLALVFAGAGLLLRGAWQAVLPALGLAIGCYVLRETVFRWGYLWQRERALLNAALAGVAVLVVALATAWAVTGQITAASALLGYAAGQGASAAVAHGQVAGWRLVRGRGPLRVAGRIWPLAKWNLLSSLTYSVRAQAYNVVAAPFVGLNGLADINAVRLLVQPGILMVPTVMQVLVPRLARHGVSARQAWRIVSGLGAAATAYGAVLVAVYVAWPDRSGWGLYADVTAVVVAWAMLLAVLGFRCGFELLAEARANFRATFQANAMTLAALVPLTVWLAQWYGSVGAVAAGIAAEAILGALLYFLGKHGEQPRPGK